MARLPYARTDGLEIQALVGVIVAQRGEVLHLYQMLLHSPPITAGWLRMMTAVRHETSLPGSLRELVIIRDASDILHPSIFFFRHPGLEPGSRCLTPEAWDRITRLRRIAGPRLKAGVTDQRTPFIHSLNGALQI